MISSSSSPVRFADTQTLYRKEGLTPPAPDVAPPSPPASWLSYGAKEDAASVPFAQFMRSDEFRTIQTQIKERVRHFQDFVRAHFHPTDVPIALGNFDTFLDRLTHDQGLAYFSESELQLLYSMGKQSMDSVSLLLDQPTLDLEQRRQALQELSRQVIFCVSAGPAFNRAQQALQQPSGTCQGVYWRTLNALIDNEILRHLAQSQEKGQAPNHGHMMEIHVANAMKALLGLPGGDATDRTNRGGALVSPGDAARCADHLVRKCRPVHVARLMTEHYIDRLKLETCERLGVKPGDLDIGNTDHLDALQETARGLEPTYPDLPLNTLLEEDIDSGAMRWRADSSLAAGALLQGLVKRGWVHAPDTGIVASGTGEGGAWTLRHADARLFHVTETSPGSAHERLLSVGRQHLPPPSANEDANAARLRRRALKAAIESAPPQALQEVSIAEITTTRDAERLLRRLGPEHSVAWVRTQPPMDYTQLEILLRAATSAGHPALLRHILSKLQAAAPETVFRVMGRPDFLATAMDQGGVEVVRAWTDFARELFPKLSDSLVRTSLISEHRGTVLPVLHKAVTQTDGPTVRAVLELVTMARAKGYVTDEAAQWFLQAPVQTAMVNRKSAGVAMIAHYAAQAVRQGRLSAETFATILAGPEAARGCAGSMQVGDVQAVKAFQSRILAYAREGLLTKAQATALMAGKDRLSPITSAIEYNRPAALAAWLESLRTGVKQGVISADRVRGALEVDGTGAISPFTKLMLMEDGRCAQVYMDHVKALPKAQRPDMAAVLGGRALNRTLEALPFDDLQGSGYLAALPRSEMRLQELSVGLKPVHRLRHWSAAFTAAAKSGALTHAQTLKLLEGEFRGQSALHAAGTLGSPASLLALTELLFQARDDRLISHNELLTLLAGFAGRGGDGLEAAVTRLPTRVAMHQLFLAAVNRRATQGSLLAEGVAEDLLATVPPEEGDANDRTVALDFDQLREQLSQQPLRRDVEPSSGLLARARGLAATVAGRWSRR